ncbi:membrane dipeptidase [Neobacillus notoginsengisoli]|uniref:Membrane dipeptidase n=1 Tax=Neobacillus notoginsengisoli TaxID=1578198 RepID=A0A417YQJ7_9BACI|nr:dipeptidase [Neobacillus notoginsengisoli]RHW36364.1 membrane dipeptidase [Neobacillus notoginsengisoli]
MKLFDAHCDALLKMFEDKSILFKNSPSLQANLEGIRKAGIKVQCFAIYVPSDIKQEEKFKAAEQMARIFHEKVIGSSESVVQVRNKKEIDRLKNDEIGAMLTLEGCDAIGDDMSKLVKLLDYGVASVGLTWNWANAVADGVMEKRGRGLTQFGRKVVKLLNQKKIWCDVSHLSERGFWDVMELADFPVASHSNSYTKCPHPRNLKDDQIRSLIRGDSVMGLTFVPYFLTTSGNAHISDILSHLDHICSLGGENHVGFGSDFDGIDQTVVKLSEMGQYLNVINELQKYYSEIQIEKFLYKNMESRLPG